MMELILNIYDKKGRTVVKSYKAGQYDIMFGTVEDIVNLIDLDAFQEDAKDMDMVTACFKFVTGGMEQVKEILMSVFPEVTEEELRYIKIREVVPLFIQLFKFSLVEMKSIGENPQKN